MALTYKDEHATAHALRQVTKAANNTAAGHKSADITFYRELLRIGVLYGVRNGAHMALISLGAAPDGEANGAG